MVEVEIPDLVGAAAELLPAEVQISAGRQAVQDRALIPAEDPMEDRPVGRLEADPEVDLEVVDLMQAVEIDARVVIPVAAVPQVDQAALMIKASNPLQRHHSIRCA